LNFRPSKGIEKTHVLETTFAA